MLTSTYSLVAIAAEHERSRGMLARLRHQLQSAWKGVSQVDFAFVDNACQRLVQFDTFFRRRKIEQYLVPVLRLMGREAQALVADLENLSARAGALLDDFRLQLRSAFELRGRPEAVGHCADGYFECVHCRLDREEHELLPLARRLLSVEDWFSVAAQMLEDDGPERGRGRRSIILPRGASPAIRRVATMR